MSTIKELKSCDTLEKFTKVLENLKLHTNRANSGGRRFIVIGAGDNGVCMNDLVKQLFILQSQLPKTHDEQCKLKKVITLVSDFDQEMQKQFKNKTNNCKLKFFYCLRKFFGNMFYDRHEMLGKIEKNNSQTIIQIQDGEQKKLNSISKEQKILENLPVAALFNKAKNDDKAALAVLERKIQSLTTDFSTLKEAFDSFSKPEDFINLAKMVMSNTTTDYYSICHFFETSILQPENPLSLTLKDDFINIITSSLEKIVKSRPLNRVNRFDIYGAEIDWYCVFGKAELRQNSITNNSILILSLSKALHNHFDKLQQKLLELKSDIKIVIHFKLKTHGNGVTTNRPYQYPLFILSPLLPHIAKFKNILNLEINENGIQAPEEGRNSKGKSLPGFVDEDAPALLDIIRNNPFMLEIKINIDGMSDGCREKFLTDWEIYWKSSERRDAILTLIK